MKYVYTTIFVNDLEKSIDFYKNHIGLEIIKKMEVKSQQIVFMGSGETKVELIYDGEKRIAPENMNISMGFECDDLEESIKNLTDSGYPPLTGIIKPNESLKFIFVKDPDGFKVQIVENN